MAIDPAADLWEAWSDGRLCLQGCSDCGTLQHPPGQVCATCLSTALALVDIEGAGTLVTWSTVHRAPAPAFAVDVPYSVAIVAVGQGALVQARISAGASTDGLVVGQPMQVKLGEVAGRVVPVVSPA